MIHIPMTITAPELTPTRAHDDDAGLDLRTADNVRIPVGGSVEVSTGVIDAGYTGTIRAKLTNHSDTPVTFQRGDRILQLVVHKLPQVNYITVKDLEQTKRGDNGFGSTGAA